MVDTAAKTAYSYLMARTSPNAWVAVDPASDRVAQALRLRRLHEAYQEGREIGTGLRAVVSQSWQRSGAAGVDPRHHLAPIVMDERELEEHWRAHPLFSALPALRTLLRDATSESGHLLAISDARGVLLWIEGHRPVVEATEAMHFVRGADWSEAGAGTNALGTALAVGHPVQIFSAEHFNRVVHRWQCSGAPVHDPLSGERLGVIDLTGHLRAAHPHTLSLVAAAARMAEAELWERARHREERLREAYLARVAGKPQRTALLARDGRVLLALPPGWLPHERLASPPPAGGGDVALPDGGSALAEPLPGGEGTVLWGPPSLSRTKAEATPRLRLRLLTRMPSAWLHDQPFELSPRHAELLTLLLLTPRGMTAEQLALELYGERGKAVTVRAELSRLRRRLGGVLRTRPYRLAPVVQADLLEVRGLLRTAGAAAALARYDQPLLPASSVPLVVQARDTLDAELRHAVMRARDPELLARWCASGSGEIDQPAAELLLRLLSPDDARRPAALARLEHLRRCFG